MSSPRWLDEDDVIHWVFRPEDTAREEDITFCWRTVTWSLRPYVDGPATCLFCVAYEERARAWG